MRAKQNLNIILLSLLFALCSMLLHAQPYAAEIQAFKSQDSASFPPKNAILFIGSSSFTKWTDVQNYFPGRKIINRAFGGSTLPDVIRYADDIVFPYNPKQVVIYCGENDLAIDSVTADMAATRFKQLFTIIRSKLPKIPIVYIGMKPSPSRRKIFGKVMVANGYIRDFLDEQSYAYYIDTYYPMLLKNGQPNGSLFTDDSLHMNAEGYKLWKYLMEPYLIRTK
ncbi:SGNH/GDSL hydrolase family protein [soil metagenome]